ncbi:MAG: DUF2306 domain-containing protein [Bacteroidota bacterium]
MKSPVLRGLMAVGAILIGLYPLLYLLSAEVIGLLQTKPESLLADLAWQTGFYLHILPGGVALIVGWSQFVPAWRKNRMKLHRQVGKLYLIAALMSGSAGLFIAFSATGGWIAKSGFLALAVAWLSTTLLAFVAVRQGNWAAHQRMMHYSYAACFGAVTLRLWMPILIPLMGAFIPAYQIIAWISWVPNLLFVWWWMRRPAFARIQPLPSQAAS